MLPTNPIAPNKQGPYLYRSERPDPNNTQPCKPVAIISHDASVTLITCSEAKLIQGRQFHCQHTKYQYPSNTASRTFINTLKSKGYGVYTCLPDGVSAYETLTELDPTMLTDMLPTPSNGAYQASPSDLAAHPVDENLLDQMLTQQTPEHINLQTLLNEDVNMEEAASSSAVSSIANRDRQLNLTQNIRSALTRIPTIASTGKSVTLRDMKIMLAILKVLQAHRGWLQKAQCIDKIEQTYPDLSLVPNAFNIVSKRFTHLISLDFITKTGTTNSFGGIQYQITPRGTAILEE